MPTKVATAEPRGLICLTYVVIWRPAIGIGVVRTLGGDGLADVAIAARPLKDGSGWYVRADWPMGQSLRVNGFAEEEEAEAWIKTKARSWTEDADQPGRRSRYLRRLPAYVLHAAEGRR